MIKNFFVNTPFECQLSYNVGEPLWCIEFNKFYEPECFMNMISLYKLTFCWRLPKEGKDYFIEI